MQNRQPTGIIPVGCVVPRSATGGGWVTRTLLTALLELVATRTTVNVRIQNMAPKDFPKLFEPKH